MHDFPGFLEVYFFRKTLALDHIIPDPSIYSKLSSVILPPHKYFSFLSKHGCELISCTNIYDSVIWIFFSISSKCNVQNRQS